MFVLLLASLQKVSNTAAGLAIFKQRSCMLGVWNSCPTHTSPTASQTRSVQPPDCSSPYPVTISRCLEKTELVWFDGKRNWFLNFPSLLQLSPPRRKLIIQPRNGENKCLQTAWRSWVSGLNHYRRACSSQMSYRHTGRWTLREEWWICQVKFMHSPLEWLANVTAQKVLGFIVTVIMFRVIFFHLLIVHLDLQLALPPTQRNGKTGLLPQPSSCASVILGLPTMSRSESLLPLTFLIWKMGTMGLLPPSRH